MSLIIRNAPIGYDARLALHAVPNINAAIDTRWIKIIKPNGQISRHSVIEFEIPINSEHYIDTRGIRLLMKVGIVRDNGTPVTNDDNVSFTNFPGASLIRQVDFSLQQQQISPGVGPNYATAAMLKVLTKHGKLGHSTILKTGLFEKDLAGVIDSHDPQNTTNTGLEERYKRTKTGQTIVLEQHLYTDFCECDKELINNVPINIKIYPTSDKFALMYPNIVAPAAGEVRFYMVNITDAVLHVPFVKLHPGILLKNEDDIKITPAPYIHPDTQVRTFNIPAQSYDIVLDNIFRDRVPNELLIVLVSAAAYSGDNQLSPHNFKHYHLSHIDFVVDGCSNEAHVFTPDFGTLNYSRAFNTLFNEYPTVVPDISYEDFIGGYAIFKFVLSPTKTTENEIPRQRKGQTRACLKFQQPLPETVTAIFCGTFVGATLIDKVRNVIISRE